jgi:hypothetical protein
VIGQHVAQSEALQYLDPHAEVEFEQAVELRESRHQHKRRDASGGNRLALERLAFGKSS